MKFLLPFVLVVALVGCGFDPSKGLAKHTQSREYSGGSISICTSTLRGLRRTNWQTPVPHYFVNNLTVGFINPNGEALQLKLDKGDLFELKVPKGWEQASLKDIVYSKLSVTSKKDRYIMITPDSNWARGVGNFLMLAPPVSTLLAATVGGVEGYTAHGETPYRVEQVSKKIFQERCK